MLEFLLSVTITWKTYFGTSSRSREPVVVMEPDFVSTENGRFACGTCVTTGSFGSSAEIGMVWIFVPIIVSSKMDFCVFANNSCSDD